MDLVRELAEFEKAPNAVTVSLQEFENSGFGKKPVWWGFVAVSDNKSKAIADSTKMVVQDPLVTQILGEKSPDVFGAQDDDALLNQGAISALGLEEENCLTDERPKAFATIQPSPETKAAPSSEQIVGFALYYIRYSTWKGERMYLEDIYVRENWRGYGVGTALMDSLLGRAKTEGFKGISWQVLDWNKDAIQFYTRYNAAFDAEWLNVSIDL